MEFLIRKAGPADVRGIMRIMEQAGTCHIHPDWFVADDEAYVRSLADKYDLLISGGSDFHGSNKPDIDIGCGRGNLLIPYELLNQFI